MGDGRTIWWAKDAGWWDRERIVALGEEFGTEGPAVIDWLSGEAKKQNDGGYVKSGPRAIARGCFASLERIPAILSRSVTLGLLDDYRDLTFGFTCRISGWKSDQDRGAAAVRKNRSRSTEPETEKLSRPVTDGHARSHTEENRDLRSPAATTAHATLREQVDSLRRVFADFGFELDEVSAAHAIEAHGDLPLENEGRGCCEWLRAHPDRPVGLTFHRWLERAADRKPSGRSKQQREADDLAALERLAGGAL